MTEEAVITEAGATLCGIQPGDVLTMRQLLYGLMLPSGNDAGAAIAVHMSQSLEGFAALMNQEAARLGATGTHFVNPHGLHDEEHYTTAYDLYLIYQEALKYPVFREVTGATAYPAEYVDKDGNPVSKTWEGGDSPGTGGIFRKNRDNKGRGVLSGYGLKRGRAGRRGEGVCLHYHEGGKQKQPL